MSKSGRQTIGNELMDQLDDSPFGLLTTPPPAKELNGETSDKPRPKTAKKSQEEDKIDNLKERMTVQMSREVIERVKDAVYRAEKEHYILSRAFLIVDEIMTARIPIY